MGLAPYGNPIYEDKVKQLLDLKEDGTFRLDQKYFNYATGLTMTSKKFHDLFGQKPRNPNKEKLTQLYLSTNLVGLILFIQILLVILTLLYGAQIVLASMHQISSIFLVSFSVYLLFLSTNQRLSN